MSNLIYKIFGGKKSLQIVLVFTLLVTLVSFLLFIMIIMVIDKNFPEGKGGNFYKSMALCRLFFAEKKSQNYKLALYILSNMDKILETGLISNPFPVDFIEIRDKNGNVLDRWGEEIEEKLLQDLLAGEVTDCEDSQTVIVAEQDGNIIVITFLPFTLENTSGQVIAGSNVPLNYIQENISVEGFKAGVYCGLEKIGGDYKGLEELPGNVIDGIKKDVISCYVFNIDDGAKDVFLYPLNYRGDKPGNILVGFIPLSSGKKELKFYITIIVLLALLVSFIIFVLLTRVLISPLEELSQKAKEIVINKGDTDSEDSRVNSGTGDLSSQLEQILDDVDKREEMIKQSSKDFEQQKQQLEIVNIKLKKAQQKLESFDSLKSQFLSNVSHEFRTPVSLIFSFAELLLADETLTGEQRNLVSDIYDSSNRLKETVDNILALPVGEEELKADRYAEGKFQDMVKKVIKSFKKEIEKKSLNFKYDYSNNLPLSILCNRDSLEHILTNLLSNAVKFTGKGGSITIKAEMTKHNPYGLKNADKKDNDSFLNISISDTGIGIKPEDQQKIFQKDFWQADASSTREYEGSGLGLIITKKLVEEMNGTVWFYSKVDEGSTFGFVIPVEIPE